MDQHLTPPASCNRSAEIKDLAAALAKAQGAMEAAEKSGVNPAFKRDGKASTYATLASVWSAVREPLSKNGLSIRQSPRTANGGVEVETELLHESGQYIRDTLWLPCPTMTVHTVGSMITYLRRYTLMSIVGIAPEDDDGTAALPSGPGSVPRVDPADQALVKNGDNRSTYQQRVAEKAPGRLAAELWASQAIGLFTMPDYDLLHYREWKETAATPGGRKNNGEKLEELREKHPDLAQEIDDAVADLKPAVLA